MNASESDLLARLTAQIERCSRAEHRLARRRTVLQDAARELRLGRPARVVEAMIAEFNESEQQVTR